MEIRNQKIIDAIVRKANRDCPGALALIGIYGSFLTGDTHEKSDLDLLILINDDRGWQLSCTFIQDDLHVGHDLYCTTWDSLEEDARYNHPNISKLMDSQIVYCADDAYRTRLDALRRQAAKILASPLSHEDFAKAEKFLKDAEHHFTRALFTAEPAEMLAHMGYIYYCIENALAMLNKAYFRYGTKRVFDELEKMHHRPEDLRKKVNAALSAESMQEQKQHLTVLMQDTIHVFENVRTQLPVHKQAVSAASISGTYEEMFSNWRNKMYYAAEKKDVHLSFMSMCSMYDMLCGIAEGVEIGEYSVLNCFESDNLLRTAQNYDQVLEAYREEYEKAGISPMHYRDIDTFIAEYMKKETA